MCRKLGEQKIQNAQAGTTGWYPVSTAPPEFADGDFYGDDRLVVCYCNRYWFHQHAKLHTVHYYPPSKQTSYIAPVRFCCCSETMMISLSGVNYYIQGAQACAERGTKTNPVCMYVCTYLYVYVLVGCQRVPICIRMYVLYVGTVFPSETIVDEGRRVKKGS